MARIFGNRLMEEGQASCGVSLLEQPRALVESLVRFAGHFQFLHGNDVFAHARGRRTGGGRGCIFGGLGLGQRSERKNQNSQHK